MAMDTTKHLAPSIPNPRATILVTVNSPMTPDKSSLIALTSYGRDFIIKGYQEFSETVLNLGRQRNPNTPNTVAMATLMYPPKLSWFSDNGPEPYNYYNQISKIDYNNHKIEQSNMEHLIYRHTCTLGLVC